MVTASPRTVPCIREVFRDPDRYLSPEIGTTVELVAAGAVLTAVEDTIGALK